MNDHDSAYDGLVDGDGHGQWAFGTSFDDPLAGVDTTVPGDVDLGALARYCLMLGDDALDVRSVRSDSPNGPREHRNSKKR